MEKLFITQWEFKPSDWKGEINNDASKTEPNKTYSLREILRRSSIGMDVTSSVRRYNEYDFDENVENPDIDGFVPPHGLDIAEAVNLLDEDMRNIQKEQEKQSSNSSE